MKETVSGLQVDLHYNVENALGEVITYEPYQGKLAVILNKDGHLKIRIPEYALGATISATVDDQPMDINIQGRYANFGLCQPGKTYTLEYPLKIRTSVETAYNQIQETCAYTPVAEHLEVKYRGNTVVQVLPESTAEKRIYKRTDMDTDQVPYREVQYFLSEKDLYW